MRALFKNLALALAALVCLACVFVLRRAPLFAGGYGYELYTGDSAAPVLVTRAPLRDKLLRAVAGESVRYAGDRVQELLAEFSAQVRFLEEAGGVTNHYCYTPLLAGETWLYGQRVNLHIACSGERTAVGTPLIFGGF